MILGRQAGLWFLAVALAPAVGFAQPDSGHCKFRDTAELTGPATGALEVTSGAGGVEIVGEAGLREVRVGAILCASSQELLDGLSVSLEAGRLATHYPEASRGAWGWWRSNYARISLAVRVPSDTALDLEDTSGAVTVSDVGSITVEDGSGSLRISGAAGDVMVEDGSGGLTIEGVTGDVVVEDGSGSLTIRSVSGNVSVADGSGGLEVHAVNGSVLVSEDGSGSIYIEQVGGGVRIADPGSGGIRVRDVEGDLTVRGTRRSRIDYRDIRGELDLPPERRRGRDRRSLALIQPGAAQSATPSASVGRVPLSNVLPTQSGVATNQIFEIVELVGGLAAGAAGCRPDGKQQSQGAVLPA